MYNPKHVLNNLKNEITVTYEQFNTFFFNSLSEQNSLRILISAQYLFISQKSSTQTLSYALLFTQKWFYYSGL